MYRNLSIYKTSTAYRVKIAGLKSFHIGASVYGNITCVFVAKCPKKTTVLHRIFVDVFGSGHLNNTVAHKDEIFDKIDRFILMVNMMNVAFEEDQKAKLEKAREYGKQYRAKMKAEREKEKANANRKHGEYRNTPPKNKTV